jgi:hypothetical protein
MPSECTIQYIHIQEFAKYHKIFIGYLSSSYIAGLETLEKRQTQAMAQLLKIVKGFDKLNPAKVFP